MIMKQNLFKFLSFNLLAVVMTMTVGFTSCKKEDGNKVVIENNTISPYKTPKYVFFFIGDGMSNTQINVTEAALNDVNFKLKSSSLKSVGIGALNIRKFPVVGMATTHAQDQYITDSAAAGTALASGSKTTVNTIGKNGDRTQNLKNMAEMAKEKGMKIGIVSSVSIDHATPACFYAHTNDRNDYQIIGEQLINSNFDYFAGGSVLYNKYVGKTLQQYKADAIAKGYKYVNTKADFNSLSKTSGKVIATLKRFDTNIQDGNAMPYALDLDIQASDDDKISLADFTQKGIDILDNEKGFFMMVEGGKVDWACHANDVVTSTFDMIAFDEAVKKALDFYNNHKEETLIIITGDHETGGLTLGFSATDYGNSFDKLNYQNISFQEFTYKVASWKTAGTKTFAQALDEVKTAFGLGDATKNLALSTYETGLLSNAFTKSMGGSLSLLPEELKLYYGTYDPFTVTVTHILNNKAGIDWTTYAHTAVPVPVFAIGQGQYEFSGYYDNTDLAKKIMTVAQFK